MSDPLRLYRALSRLPWPRTYQGKFLLLAFLGVHVPLLAVLGYVVATARVADAAAILVVALLATVTGMLATVYSQRRLLEPVLQTAAALERYVLDKAPPRLPTEFGDEAGCLMRDAQACVTHLDELLERKNRLIATLSHDARSPLLSIVFANQLMRSAVEGPEVDRAEALEMCDIIEQAAERQRKLMEHVMTLARADGGGIAVEQTNAGLGDILREVCDGARLPAEQKGIRLEVELPLPGAGQRLLLDAAKSEQVLANLVHNAVKFTPSGGRVTVGIAQRDEEVGFYVEDTGIGIPPAALDQLFRPFTAAQRAGTDAEAGTGLGLWIARTFTELQGGRIEVCSTVGEGTRFEVLFPRARLLQEVQADPVATELKNRKVEVGG